MVDWTVPQPSYEELHAKLDAIATERNAAVAESKLWLRRLQEALRERDQARANYAACDQSHEAWEKAYDDLLRDFRRLELKLTHTEWDLDYWKSLAGFYEAGMKAKIGDLIGRELMEAENAP